MTATAVNPGVRLCSSGVRGPALPGSLFGDGFDGVTRGHMGLAANDSVAVQEDRGVCVEEKDGKPGALHLLQDLNLRSAHLVELHSRALQADVQERLKALSAMLCNENLHAVQRFSCNVLDGSEAKGVAVKFPGPSAGFAAVAAGRELREEEATDEDVVASHLGHRTVGGFQSPTAENEMALMSAEENHWHPESLLRHKPKLAKRLGARMNGEMDNSQPPPPRHVFNDLAAMKEQVRKALARPQYSVKDLYHDTGWAQFIAKSNAFEYVCIATVGLNSIWIAIDADLNSEPVLSRAHPVFQVVEHTFCVFFLVELLIRLGAFKRPSSAFSDTWFVFDFMLVAMMVFETWIITIFIWLFSAGSAGMGLNASMLKMIRIARLTRMARMARLISWMPELVILLKGLWMAGKSVFFTLLLLVATVYIFGTMFRQLTDDTDVGRKYFSSVPHAMLSLLLDGVLPDLAALIKNVGQANILLGALLLLFVLLASLTVMNMLIGVLVEVVATVSRVENESMMVSLVRVKMHHMIDEMGLDTDGNGALSREEFESLLVMPLAAQFMQDIGVDVVGLVEYSDYIFRDKVDLELTDFIELIIQLRGSNTATVKDIVDTRKQMMQELETLSTALEGMCDQIVGVLAAPGNAASRHSPGPSTPSQHTVPHQSFRNLDAAGSNGGSPKSRLEPLLLPLDEEVFKPFGGTTGSAFGSTPGQPNGAGDSTCPSTAGGSERDSTQRAVGADASALKMGRPALPRLELPPRVLAADRKSPVQAMIGRPASPTSQFPSLNSLRMLSSAEATLVVGHMPESPEVKIPAVSQMSRSASGKSRVPHISEAHRRAHHVNAELLEPDPLSMDSLGFGSSQHFGSLGAGLSSHGGRRKT